MNNNDKLDVTNEEEEAWQMIGEYDPTSPDDITGDDYEGCQVCGGGCEDDEWDDEPIGTGGWDDRDDDEVDD